MTSRPLRYLLLIAACPVVLATAACTSKSTNIRVHPRKAPPAPIPQPIALPQPEPELRIATLNVAHGRGTVFIQIGLPKKTFLSNLAEIAALLEREGPDVVALQEADASSTWSGRFDHVAHLAEAAGYPHRVHGLHVEQLGVRYGTALLSKTTMADATSIAFNAEPLDTKGFVVAKVRMGQEWVRVVSIHLDFKLPATRNRQARTMIAALRKEPGPMVLLGDFNCTWQDENDALRLIVRELNLEAHACESGKPTFPSGKPSRRIDWILLTSDLEFQMHETWPDTVSDHLGVMAKIKKKNRQPTAVKAPTESDSRAEA